jgi:hypothetical protein
MLHGLLTIYKKIIMNTKHIKLLVILLGFVACNDIEDVSRLEPETQLPELTAGSADFSNYVAIGASFTAGYRNNLLRLAEVPLLNL